jgi:CLIP-associating protein 1/2
MSSLRTQLCLKSCELVKDLAIVTGPAIDPHVDFFLTTFVKLSAGTKKLVLQATQLIVSIILANVSYNHKLTAQIWIAMQDKNMNPRICSSAWLRILLDAHGESKSQIEHGQGIENIEKTIKKGLADPSPDVRMPMRETFWTFARLWPDRAEAIMAKLDVSGRKALEKANPNAEGEVTSGRSSVLSKPADLGASVTSVTSSVGAANRNPLSGRVSVKKFAAEQRKKIESEEPSGGGLHSGAVRGLGQPQRPQAGLKRLETVPSMPRPASPSSSTTKTTRTGSPPRKGTSTRTGSPPVSPKRKAGPLPRPSPLQTMTSPVGVPIARPVGRRLTVLEQLVHPEWRIRVEGIITVACLLAKKDPPGHPPGQKLPTLPPLDMLSPTLQKLLNDPQPDVVYHLLAPEVIPEIVKIIPVDQIVPRLLLLSEMEDEEHVKDTLSSSLPALKRLFTDAEAADMLSKALMSMGISGVVPRKMSVGFFTTTQKRKIIHGIFLWMIELVERHNSQISAGETGNEYFLDEMNYKQYIHRLVPMITNTKPTSNNYVPLTTLLRVLRQCNQDVFDKVLSTFERSAVTELKRAWGQPVDDQEDTVIYEEKVVTVHEVLGDVKVGGLTTVGSSSVATRPPGSPSPPRSRIPVRSPPSSPRVSQEFHPPKSPTENTTMNIDEDLTMISLPQPSGLDKEIEQPRGRANGKGDTSPTRHRARTNSRDEKSQSISGPLGTFARDLRKGIFSSTINVIDIDLPDVPLSQEIMDQQKLLINLIARLESKQMDSPGFHSLSRLCRKSHVDVIQDSPTEAEYLWQGGNKFNELLRALLEYLISTDFVFLRT